MSVGRFWSFEHYFGIICTIKRNRPYIMHIHNFRVRRRVSAWETIAGRIMRKIHAGRQWEQLLDVYRKVIRVKQKNNMP